MERCKNDRSKTYAGTEPSPRGLGWYAGGDPVGKTRKGRDGARWTVAQDKNGRKTWRPSRPPHGGGAVFTMGTLPPAILRRSLIPPRTGSLAVQGAAVDMKMRMPAINRTQASNMTLAPYRTIRAPQMPEQRAPCIDPASMEREINACMDAMMPLGASGCMSTLTGVACMAAMKVLVNSVSPEQASDLERIADKLVNVAFDIRGMDKPFDVTHGWQEIGNKATRAIAKKCAGMDSGAVTAVGEAFL